MLTKVLGFLLKMLMITCVIFAFMQLVALLAGTTPFVQSVIALFVLIAIIYNTYIVEIKLEDLSSKIDKNKQGSQKNDVRMSVSQNSVKVA